jgi:hypothetical protein
VTDDRRDRVWLLEQWVAADQAAALCWEVLRASGDPTLGLMTSILLTERFLSFARAKGGSGFAVEEIFQILRASARDYLEDGDRLRAQGGSS